MDDEFDATSHAEAFTLWEEAETMTIDLDEIVNQEAEEEEEKQSSAETAVAAAAAVAAIRAPPRRTDSSVIRGVH